MRIQGKGDGVLRSRMTALAWVSLRRATNFDEDTKVISPDCALSIAATPVMMGSSPSDSNRQSGRAATNSAASSESLKEIVCVMDLMSYQEYAITIILNCAKTRGLAMNQT